MIKTPTAELEKLARDAAREIAGPHAVEQLEIENVIDLDDRPAYHFTFLVNKDRVGVHPGLFRVDLALKLLDELTARGDEHRPLIRFLDRRDWEKRGSARLYR